jgi:transposase-like protein
MQKCGSELAVKNNFTTVKPQYKCKTCGYNFRTAVAKVLYRMLGCILRINNPLVYRGIRPFCENLNEPDVPGEIRHMESDEMRYFIGLKKL